jgi:uncharacterized protein YutE (UPF0331/DUF86 family)
MIQRKKLRVKEIEKKISDVLDALEVISSNFPEDFGDFLKMGLAKDGLYKKTEFSIESIIDICNILNSDLRLGVPDTEEDMLDRLEKKKVLSKKVIEIIRQMKGFRNILVHKYGDIDDKKAYEDIRKGIDDFEIVIKEIEGLLKGK